MLQCTATTYCRLLNIQHIFSTSVICVRHLGHFGALVLSDVISNFPSPTGAALMCGCVKSVLDYSDRRSLTR